MEAPPFVILNNLCSFLAEPDQFRVGQGPAAREGLSSSLSSVSELPPVLCEPRCTLSS